MVNKEEARALYLKDLSAGYSPAKARDRLKHFKETGIALPDPTEKYWDSLTHQESRGNQAAVSPKGATGVAQVMPATGPEAAALAGVGWDPVAFKEDAAYNERLGRAYFRKQMEDNNMEPERALSAYNAGPGANRKAGGDLSKLPAETQHYVSTIMLNSESNMQPDLDDPADVAAAQEALMTPRERARKIYQSVIEAGGSPEEAKAAIAGLVQRPAPQQPQVQQPIEAPVAQPQALSVGDDINQYLTGEMQRKGGGYVSGVQSSAIDLLQGARKLYNQAVGDDDTVKRIEDQVQSNRDYWNTVDPAGSGFSPADAGKLTGSVGTAGGLGAAIGSSAKAATLAGALQGLMQPTTADDSQLANTAVGGVLGGVGAKLGDVLRNFIGKADPERAASAALLRQRGVDIPRGQEYESQLGSALGKVTGEDYMPNKSLTKELSKYMGMGGDDITNETLESNLRSKGSAIGSLFSKDEVSPDLKFFKDLTEAERRYKLSGPDIGQMDKVKHLMKIATDTRERILGGEGKLLTGEEYQALRSGLTSASTQGSAAEKELNKSLLKSLDELFERSTSHPEASTLRSQYRLSKILRQGQGIPAEGATAKQLRNKIESAANKGQVNQEAREVMGEASRLIPSSRVGGEVLANAEAGVASPILHSGASRGILEALVRGAMTPAKRGLDTGVLQMLLNSPDARKSLAALLRGGVIPQATNALQGEQ